MNFHEVRFPASLSFGSVGGPERRTEIVTLSNGFEERNTPWAHSRRRYDAGLGMRSLDDLSDLIAFFEARKGQLYGFRWKDWTDFSSGRASALISPVDEEFGIGDDETTVFQLARNYRSGAHSYRRPITKPVVDTLQIAIGGDEREEGVHYSVDYTTGLVTFVDPPETDAPVTAGYEFDVPVRFDADRIETSMASFSAGEIPSVPVVEVRV